MKKTIRTVLMLLYALGMAVLLVCGYRFLRSLNVERSAENTSFFELFPEAESRPISLLREIHFQGAIDNADLFSLGGDDLSYARLTAEEEQRLREILAEIKISPKTSSQHGNTIGGTGDAIGFKKFYLSRSWVDYHTMYLTVCGLDSGTTYYVTNIDQAQLLEDYWVQLSDKYKNEAANTADFSFKWKIIRHVRELLLYKFPIFTVVVAVLFALGELGLFWLFRSRRQKNSPPAK